ncbi:hypothetical protein [Streptomyces hawaiiensis]|jgi:hypothetical protein|uniref:hypothetical protein n=1 Tax=Streptomyces hawaiiensis TaxID=67305 RepID=UPI00366742DC
MERRDFLTITGTAVSALAAAWASGAHDALAQAHDGKPVSEDLVAFLENSIQHFAGLSTEQRQHTPALLDAHLVTVPNYLRRAVHDRPRAAPAHPGGLPLPDCRLARL